jgi:hypothetical protein
MFLPRYSFNDTHQAPIWFQDAEKKYNKRMMPVTKAQVEEMKMRAMEVRMLSKLLRLFPHSASLLCAIIRGKHKNVMNFALVRV